MENVDLLEVMAALPVIIAVTVVAALIMYLIAGSRSR